MLSDIIKSYFEKAQEQRKAEGYIKLERGFATIPLPGIDVPFLVYRLISDLVPEAHYFPMEEKVISIASGETLDSFQYNRLPNGSTI
jgi:hypothetical protein